MDVLRHQFISCVALEPPDLHRLTFGGFAHAGFLTQGFGRANAGAHAAHDILCQNGFRGGFGCAGGDLANKQRDIDVRRASRNTGRIVAEIASVRRDQRFMVAQRRMQIRKSRVESLGVKSTSLRSRLQSSGVHHHLRPQLELQ